MRKKTFCRDDSKFSVAKCSLLAIQRLEILFSYFYIGDSKFSTYTGIFYKLVLSFTIRINSYFIQKKKKKKVN